MVTVLDTGGVVVSASQRRWRARLSRGLILWVFGFYVLAPLYAGARFALENDNGNFSLHSVAVIPAQAGFTDAFWYSTRLALATVIGVLVLVVPTIVYAHLRAPKVRPALETISLLPIVFPPIVLILGFMHTAPTWLLIWPYHLAVLYVVISLPFVYRSLDAGLLALDLNTLVEAGRSLGARMSTIVWRVILPNLSSALISSVALVIALVYSEYTMASFQVTPTLPVWIAQFSMSDGHITTAAAMLSLVGAWVLLAVVLVSDLGRLRWRLRRAQR